MTYNFRFVGFQRNQALFDIDKVFLAIEKSLADCLKLALLHDSPVYIITLYTILTANYICLVDSTFTCFISLLLQQEMVNTHTSL